MEKEFWEQRWKEGNTGWDIGYPAPAIMKYLDSITDKSINILIPGCGNAYEAQGIYDLGYKNIWVIDITAQAVTSFADRCPDFPRNQIIHGDFFDCKELEEQGGFDLIIEQTFFCAIHPQQRDNYCRRMAELMREEGQLVGLLFDFPLDSGPPFGGSRKEYQDRFSRYFSEVKIESCQNSIQPRLNRELWIEMAKPIQG